MANSPVILEFGPYRLEPAERRLAKGQAAVALTPKAFDLLVFLVEHPDRLLKKEELLEHLWPGVFVEEVNLAQNISALRRALGGESRESYIQTIAGTGYRFVAPVTRAGPASSSVPRESTERKRVIVLPFRMLKPDADLDFLAFSLPDALTSELSSFNSLIVRSSLVAARFASETPDLPRIAAEAQVDFVVSGTILRAGSEVRVSAHLADAVAGTVVWSHTVQAPIGDLFKLQDLLVAKIAGSIARPLASTAERSDVPANAHAYELFLRANDVARKVTGVTFDDAFVARDLYLQSLRADPNYAPAWTRLARIYRVLGKYRPEDSIANLNAADDALQRALAINPNLLAAHSLLAQGDVDRGQAAQAMVRLFDLLRRRGPHAEIFAALVQACRCCGLLDASIAAHEQVQKLDPAVETGVMHSYFLQRRYEEAIVASGIRRGYVWGLSMAALGRGDEAIPVVAGLPGMFASVHALLLGEHERSIELMLQAMQSIPDPEGHYYGARLLAHLGATGPALDLLAKSVAGGYLCVESFMTDNWLDALRGDPQFTAIVDRARVRHELALAAFQTSGGAQLLGMK